jgi:hypothetical protein
MVTSRHVKDVAIYRLPLGTSLTIEGFLPRKLLLAERITWSRWRISLLVQGMTDNQVETTER